jgi:cobalt-zinc-cadmium efflux system outer membrane protein
MRRLSGRTFLCLFPLLAIPGYAQTPLSWDEVRERFRRNNHSLQAGQTFVDENHANETTAGLRPNPQLSAIFDQWRLFQGNPYRPLGTAQSIVEISQLIERRNKRGLRVASAQLATAISSSDLADLERQLIFNLRDAFVRTLQAKSVLELTQENLRAYDTVIDISRLRYESGDLSRSDFDRISLQRAQFESDLENAKVNLRTAKIQILALLNDRQPVDTFDVSGAFEFGEKIVLPGELYRMALEDRGDVRSADTAILKAEADNRLAWANGSSDPAVGADFTRVGPDNTVGVAVNVPLRIFDKNQGEKARTALEIRRTQQLRDALLANVSRDIDSAYAAVESVRGLLRPYRDRYLPQAERVRESVSFAYSRGGSSLLDFLDAQKSYRDAQLTYRNLVATYLSAVNQLNLAVGREVLQ